MRLSRGTICRCHIRRPGPCPPFPRLPSNIPFLPCPGFFDCQNIAASERIRQFRFGLTSIDSNLSMEANTQLAGTQSCPPPELPQLVAEQHVPISAHDKETQRLIVVLSHASLETFRASHGGRSGTNRDEKYSLLNSDEHIGVMRKMNRDISEARPDITHQVSSFPDHPTSLSGPVRMLITAVVSSHPSRLARQQGRETADLHSHRQGCPD